MISFIIPAHNEEALLGRTLGALSAAANAVGEPFEVFVANDGSTDRTGEVAREQGAAVVDIDRRQIAAARNAGARAASGEIFIFVDADTMITEPALSAAIRAVRGGVVGGGCTVRFDGQVPLYAAILERIIPPICRAVGMAPGCFLFCSREAYLAVRGFNEELYVAEEVAFGQALKRLGRFVILREHVVTSARKLRTRTALDLVRIAVRIARGGSRSFRRREGLEYWYGPRDPQPSLSDSPRKQ
jgi:glycosyltransferase involved in cell wall biosynthesis